MKISESWLREWADPDLDSEGLAHQLTMIGLEVDTVQPVAGELDKVVVGQVLDVQSHPEAERLSVCRVDVGADEPLNIVCGAANVRAGGCYPTALAGARLAGNVEIRRSKIRGQDSDGMLCSAQELGLTDASDGILELGDDAPIGGAVADVLGLNDQVIDIDLTPNRADCFCVIGVARDLAASLRLPFAEPKVSPVSPEIDERFPVRIDDRAGCPRFVGRVIRGIDPKATTPMWLQERLRRSGMRPIQPIVDVTNYVMLELGQPLHAYDLELLTEEIVVRRANNGETLELLDGQQLDLVDDMLVIADSRGAVGLAGIMGGQSTAVSAETRDVYFEAAFFSPEVIAGRARRFGLHTDASIRFERGVDPVHQARAIERATALLVEIAGGEPGPVVDEYIAETLPPRPPVTLRRERLAAVLGTTVPDAEVIRIFSGLHMDLETVPEGWVITPPPARFDIELEADLIEEVARLIGYDTIPETPGGLMTTLGAVTEYRVPVDRARLALVDRGYQEAITYSFIGRELDQQFSGATGMVELSNPISGEMAVMRRSLWPGLIQVMQRNLSRQAGRVRLFESGIRFSQQDTDIIEEDVLAGIVAGGLLPEQWDGDDRAADLFDIKSDVTGVLALTAALEEFEFEAAEHRALRPGRAAQIRRSGETIGWVGELHPALVTKLELTEVPVMFEMLTSLALAARPPVYRGISKYPVIRRDVALVVDAGLPVASIERAARESAGEQLRNVVVFDIYTGENIETGSKSVALGLILQDTSRTLTDADADAIRHGVVKHLSREFNATIRE